MEYKLYEDFCLAQLCIPVAGKQGGGKEIMRDEECNSETGKNRSEERHLR
jgi:hypothetical protein